MPNVLRMLNLGAGGDPTTLALDAGFPRGYLGGIYEDNSQGRFQFFEIADATVSANQVLYAKSHSGVYTATPTVGNSSAYELAGIAGTTVTAGQATLLQQGGVRAVKANGVFARGTPVWPDSGNNRVVPAGVFSGSLAAVTTAGGVLAVTNPLTGAWLVTSLILNRTTKSTGASTSDYGIAANATTSNDGLIDGLNSGATEANGENNFANAGTNGKAAQYGAAGTVLTGSQATGDVTGLVGTYSGTFAAVGFNSLPVIGIAQAAISSGNVSTFLNIRSI